MPSKVVMDEDQNKIEVVVSEPHLSLAIGRRGQNVKLATELTGWEIDILTEDEDSSKRQQDFNEKTKNFMGKPVPVIITVYKDKKFDFIIKSPPASHYIKEAAKLKGGSSEPGRQIVASITKKQAEEIAKKKMTDLNANDLEQAVKIISGSARSMGIEVKE